MQIISVFGVSLISVIHLGDSRVKHVLKEALFMHFIDIQGQALGQSRPHIFSYHEQILSKKVSYDRLV